ncbi:hypothetical protein FE236_03755 [Mariprofundus erugo]|uniref:EF-hand domain-containing protein n=1 Tax=Mariprofundus erugo TaxID=2528639 RepID=A0A5R9GLS1_9PROT|nr:hypothetical protein [Mariprofundus erugo]TLS67030.1 hypothetical protein FEF65_08770 [Mariprofundus erugo]TLS77268.1 hypothetical protein FE236_03755 [Mariprofundus erugo]
MHTTPLRYLAAPLLALTLCCHTPPARADGLEAFDSNGDGEVSFEEVMKHLEPGIRKSFDALDRNHDGVLSAKDFDDLHQGLEKLDQWLKELIKPLLQKPENEGVEV